MKRKWYDESIGYQIYIKSFYDSNGDGIGDLNGISGKLDYLKDIGVDFIWITPFYKSPMDDNGYDVSDFYRVDRSFGNINDFKNLSKECKKRNIKIIVDLVLNHTSDEHFWFLESKKRENNKYKDYYIWKEGKKDSNSKETYPTNWGSFFGGSVWKKDERSGEYYLKIFSDKMPDLNWECEDMRQDIYKVVKYWEKIGVDGFRIDAVAHLAKDTHKDSDKEMEDNIAYDWDKFSNLPKVHEYIKEMVEESIDGDDKLLVGEVGGGATILDALKYTLEERKEFSMVFTFDHFNVKKKNENGEYETDVIKLKKIISKWQNDTYGKSHLPIFWLNHDEPRVASKYGSKDYHKESCKALATAMYFLRGTVFVYNGEEIGMTNYPFKDIEEFDDVKIKNKYKVLKENGASVQELEKFMKDQIENSRDNARTPMQWSSEENAGFSKNTPWFKINPNYKEINVEDSLKDEDSILNHYKKIFKIRKSDEYKEVLCYGKYTEILNDNENIYAYIRESEKMKVLVISNFSKNDVVIKNEYEIKDTILSSSKNHKIEKDEIFIGCFESLVLRIS